MDPLDVLGPLVEKDSLEIWDPLDLISLDPLEMMDNQEPLESRDLQDLLEYK